MGVDPPPPMRARVEMPAMCKVADLNLIHCGGMDPHCFCCITQVKVADCNETFGVIFSNNFTPPLNFSWLLSQWPVACDLFFENMSGQNGDSKYVLCRHGYSFVRYHPKTSLWWYLRPMSVVQVQIRLVTFQSFSSRIRWRAFPSLLLLTEMR